jgi:hypothetical protein
MNLERRADLIAGGGLNCGWPEERRCLLHRFGSRRA